MILFTKPGKSVEEITSYRPSVLPVLSKVFKKLLIIRLKLILEEQHVIPEHQFGFEKKHANLSKVRRVAANIREDLDERKY